MIFQEQFLDCCSYIFAVVVHLNLTYDFFSVSKEEDNVIIDKCKALVNEFLEKRIHLFSERCGRALKSVKTPNKSVKFISI